MDFKPADELLIAVGKAAEDAGWNQPPMDPDDFHRTIGQAVLGVLLGGPETGAYRIAGERAEHSLKHGWDLTRDQDYGNKQLVLASKACTCLYNGHHILAEHTWPWKDEFGMRFFEKIRTKSKIDQLQVAGSFLAAEMDRLTFLANYDHGRATG